MRIGILVAGHVPDEMIGKYGDYDHIFSQFLADPQLTFKAYPVVDGVFPENLDEADGWLITGSKYGAYEPHPWIPPLEDLIRKIYEARMPLIGVCFGHQIIAQALGGRVEKFGGGWIAGPCKIERDDIGGEQQILAWHQDQVTKKPDAAEVVGSSPGCEFAILRYGPNVLTYQAHPEFTPDFIKDLAEARQGLLPPEMEANVASSEPSTDRAALAKEIKHHWLDHQPVS
ncbi:type 1 glutamine amidotransferase [Rhizobium sp. L1K21]|uniref:type 1 glutamine amidotransferase n=1 Tax=Rhizobium sp. L1K21 TaxID=2954933 RepID=UPI0020922239|nr:type 1 glutamine amidotransferase [Rhizobium sp. L1K21]MCO6184700.1 type 1 glutamine amidotransferase [Rhizobium sp. L1K21]